MPSRAKTLCTKCRTALIRVGSGGLCARCKAKSYQQYNRFQRDQESQAFYNSNKWRKLRDKKIKLDPLCEQCRDNDLVVTADMVHHIIERKEGGSDTIDNLQSLCFACHEKVTDRRRRDKS